MLSAEIHKDLTRYRAKVVAGLSARTLACVAAALATGVAVGGYLTWVLGLEFEQVSIVIYASTIPLWALGFWEPSGMKPERWLPLWLRHQGSASRLTYSNRGRYLAAYDVERRAHVTSKAYQAFSKKQRGIELWDFGCREEG